MNPIIIIVTRDIANWATVTPINLKIVSIPVTALIDWQGKGSGGGINYLEFEGI